MNYEMLTVGFGKVSVGGLVRNLLNSLSTDKEIVRWPGIKRTQEDECAGPDEVGF